MIVYTEQEKKAAMAAAEYVHNATCTFRHDWQKCPIGRALYSPATIQAMHHLTEHPRDVATVRSIYHDAACMSGGASCTPPGDHAKRTQSKTAAALRKYMQTLTYTDTENQA